MSSELEAYVQAAENLYARHKLWIASRGWQVRRGERRAAYSKRSPPSSDANELFVRLVSEGDPDAVLVAEALTRLKLGTKFEDL